MACRRFTISGRVQGVWFRASTRAQAVRLGLTGRAINLADGRVEVVACGGDGELDQLASWLTRGPDRARVDNVTTEPMDDHSLIGFDIG
jgi:acylphosphatase